MEKVKEKILTIEIGWMKFKSQIYGLKKSEMRWKMDLDLMKK